MDKLLLPDGKIRQIYAYLLIKAIDRKSPIISYSDVEEAIAVAGIMPNKYQIKKYLLILNNNNPTLLKFHRAGLLETYFRLLIYKTNGKDIQEINLKESIAYRDDLLLTLSDESTENTLTYTEVLKKRLQKGGEDV